MQRRLLGEPGECAEAELLIDAQGGGADGWDSQEPLGSGTS